MVELPYLDVVQRLALCTAGTRLRMRFDGIVAAATIGPLLHSSYTQLISCTSNADVLLHRAERFTQQRLEALIKTDGHGHDGKPAVLFLSPHDDEASQMALGFFRHLTGDGAVAWSGGSEPGHEITHSAISVMTERDIDISHEFPTPRTSEIAQAADVVITIGCAESCPAVPGKRHLDWRLDDTTSHRIEDIRQVRDTIEQHTRNLVSDLRGEPTPCTAP
nr:hypothetical protein [Kibdelosporangium sp. MJ126-NF4]CEL17488.1 Arsenate reductase [Kibdelosporangium sp. MJ126-NF4]CTQ91285.1 Arsenate reductase (EC 1.20.4.1) [Kibdelosporangium sp. MJ126-NF4]